ncbi:small ribosomal subunit protein mL104 (rPPR9) [Aristolochia californica]|uniref:small ribosomal subunit protein mL104 (rPPR9) n=1 Tax=Aristolochia californica TaxID=171875 RepID=UPI0035DBA310
MILAVQQRVPQRVESAASLRQVKRIKPCDCDSRVSLRSESRTGTIRSKMPKPPPPLQLCRLFHRRIFASNNPSSPFRTLNPLPSPTLSFSRQPPFFLFSSVRLNHATPDRTVIAQSVAHQLRQPDATSEEQPLSLSQRLEAHFSHLTFDQSLVQQVLNLSADAGRKVLTFRDWLSRHPKAVKTDDVFLSNFVEYLGRNNDFKAIHDLLAAGCGIAGEKCFTAAVDRLARAGRPTQVVQFFEKMEKDYGIARDRGKVSVVVSSLCGNGFTGHAERFVKKIADEFFPDEMICDTLVRGWSAEGKLDEARRLVGEITRGGFDLGTAAYNSILDCVCKLCRKKDPFRLQSEAEKILLEMDVKGIPRNVETFNVLIANYAKIRKTEDALKLFDRMHEWGCSPDATTYILVIRSLYQAARFGEGDEYIDRMKSTGFGKYLDKKAYYGFIKILCGIERIEHAMKVFAMMKRDGCQPGIKTYGLLIEKLATHDLADRANAVFREAVRKKLPVEPKAYSVHPRYMKKPKTKKKEKKKETLPEKIARKRRRLKKLRLSYVKKPRYGLRRLS